MYDPSSYDSYLNSSERTGMNFFGLSLTFIIIDIYASLTHITTNPHVGLVALLEEQFTSITEFRV